MGMVVIAGGFTLDDTVLMSDEVMRRAPGGNILYAAVGANIWSDEVGLFGIVGFDYPQEYLDSLENHGFDISGVTRVKEPTIKMWALHEKNSKRQLFYKLDSGSNEYMDPRVNFATDEYISKISALHIAAIPVPSQREIINRFSGVNSITLDTINIPNKIDPTPFRDLANLAGVDVFLPSIEEVHDIWGEEDLKGIVRSICKNSSRDMVIKMGARGCLAYKSSEDKFYMVPAPDVKIKDTTGAGDTFCGGFVAGLKQTGDVLDAAVKGCVSAGFTIQDFGGIHAIDTKLEDAQKYYNKIYKDIYKY